MWALSLFLLFTTTVNASPPSKGPNRYEPRPYVIDVNPAIIEEARTKVAKFRHSADINAPAWFDGPAASEIESFAKYWVEEYNWSAMQAEINRNFSHFFTTVPPTKNYHDPVDLHFIHQRSKRKDAIPILFMHGWPSGALEWQKIIPGLVNPEHDNDPAFHVVAPDFPGFSFSPPLNGSRAKIDRSDYASIFASLMEQLGYDRYIVYSTDLGYVVALSLVVDYKERVINHVSDFYLISVSAADQARFAANQTLPEETAYINSSNAFFGPHSGYSHIHSTYPLTLAYALNDSPLGFLSWIYHVSQSVNDKQYSAEEIITITLLNYLPGAYSNIRMYKEVFSPTSFIPDKNFTVPTSVLQFGGFMHYPELANWNFVPREWVERTANLTYFARHESGGHFPALSEPGLVLGELRKIFA